MPVWVISIAIVSQFWVAHSYKPVVRGGTTEPQILSKASGFPFMAVSNDGGVHPHQKVVTMEKSGSSSMAEITSSGHISLSSSIRETPSSNTEAEKASVGKVMSQMLAQVYDTTSSALHVVENAAASSGDAVEGVLSRAVAASHSTAPPAASKGAKIPRQLILTGKSDRFEDEDPDIQSNVLATVALSINEVKGSPSLLERQNIHVSVRPRWFGNPQCRAYIKEHYDEELLDMFEHAHPGYYKGDICRAAILYQEGGFYTDIDVQLAVPLDQLVDKDTTFMSAYSINGDIFNGLIAAVPKSEVLGETLQEIRRWYRGEAEQKGLMGTMTMLRGLENVVGNSCSTKDLKSMQNTSQWDCGANTIRLYQESDLLCFVKKGVAQPAECPQSRKDGELFMRYGLFKAGERVYPGRSFIGWPKGVKCKSTRCGEGHEN